MEPTLKVRENKARRAAIRQGMELQKSRLRDPRALGFGGYMLVDAKTGKAVFGDKPHPHSASLGDVEKRLG